MTFLETIVLVAHVLVAAAICGFVLLQHGKGADMGAAFGSGASGSLFGASGSANFLSRTTAILAAVFFVSSLALTYLGSTHGAPKSAAERSVMDTAPTPPKSSEVPTQTAPAPAPANAPVPAGGAATSKSGEIPK